METILLHGEQEKELEKAAQLLRAGETVAFPTETVYGLGANALDADAARKIYEAKGRPSDNPLIVHIYDKKQLAELTDTVPDLAQQLMDTFWPGPLTLIFKKREGAVPSCVTGGLDTVAVRMPNHPVALHLLRLTDLPIAAPSANLSGKPSPTAVAHVQHDLNGRIAAIVSGGNCAVGVESTVLDVSGEIPVILRPGGVTKEQLEEVIGGSVRYAAPFASAEETPRAPGMKYTHYAPDAPVYICTGTPEEIAAKIDQALAPHHGGAGVMLSAQTLQLLQNSDENLVVNLGSREDLKQITCNLFAALRYFDDSDVEAIYTEDFPTEEIGAALMNRLQKAAGSPKSVKVGETMNILFVCTGNTCRSAMAEAAARQLIQEQPEQYGAFQVASAGVMCAGPSPASPQAVIVAQQNGCDLSHFTAKQVTETLVQEADYIFVMTRRHKMMLDAALPQYSDKVFLLNAYAAGDPTASEIPDPFGGSVEEYAQCFAVLQESIQAVFEK